MDFIRAWADALAFVTTVVLHAIEAGMRVAVTTKASNPPAGTSGLRTGSATVNGPPALPSIRSVASVSPSGTASQSTLTFSRTISSTVPEAGATLTHGWLGVTL